MVAFLERQIDEFVDEAGHMLFVGQGGFEGGERAFPLRFGTFDGRKLDSPAPLRHEVEEFHGVEGLFLVLDTHPVGESWQIDRVEVGGHGEVEVGGVVFRIDLVIESCFHFGAKHGSFLWQVNVGWDRFGLGQGRRARNARTIIVAILRFAASPGAVRAHKART